MGQKVNPVLFRSKYLKVDSLRSSIIPSHHEQFSHSIFQDSETKKFLFFLLSSKGIFLRSCRVQKTSEKLLVDLDLYFTSLFFKKSKLGWVKSFFKTMKKEHTYFKKIKEVKGFVEAYQSLQKTKKKKLKYVSLKEKKVKYSLIEKGKQKVRKIKLKRYFSRQDLKVLKKGVKFSLRKKKGEVQRRRSLLNRLKLRPKFRKKKLKLRLSGRALMFRKKKGKLFTHKKGLKSFKIKKAQEFEIFYRRRLFYVLCYQKKKELFLKKEEDQEGVFSLSQIHRKPGFDLVKTKMSKLSRFFGLRKLRYNFSSLCLTRHTRAKKRSQSLLEVNKYLCKVLQNYYGVEQVCVKMTSAQLFLLPFLKRQKKVFVKKLSAFQRNRSLQKYFHETVELFYFLHLSYSKGNAFLLAKYIAYLLEKNRKQLMIVKFLNKCMQAFFKTLTKTSSKSLSRKKKKLFVRKKKAAPSLGFLAIRGMRILIKGRLNKRRRTKKFLFSTGQFSLQTMDIGVDYHQTQANTIYGSFGIKVWIAKQKKVKI